MKFDRVGNYFRISGFTQMHTMSGDKQDGTVRVHAFLFLPIAGSVDKHVGAYRLAKTLRIIKLAC